MWPPRTRCGCWARIRGPPAARASWRDFEFCIEVVPDSLEIGNQGPLVPDIVEFLEFPDRIVDLRDGDLEASALAFTAHHRQRPPFSRHARQQEDQIDDASSVAAATSVGRGDRILSRVHSLDTMLSAQNPDLTMRQRCER